MDGQDLLSFNDRLWAENARLQDEVRRLRGELARREDVSSRLAAAEKKLARLAELNAALRKQLLETTPPAVSTPDQKSPAPPPAFVKANKLPGPRKSPGRKAGHAPALRPVPAVDVHRDVPLSLDSFGAPCCTECHSQLNDLRSHERIVEEIVPAKAVVICYRTTSGWCPYCRKTVESRATQQPPAPPGVDLPQGQLGINALVTAAIMRVCYRLPLRQITKVFHQLPGLKLSPGAVARQLQRLAKWLEDQYERLKLALRISGVVYADETSWRTDGRNAQLWTLTDARHTLYHVDPSRGGKVIADLLGAHFNADGKSTLVSDFYAAYDQFDGPQQKCLAHLLRELKQTAESKPQLKDHPFLTRSRRLLREMLALRRHRDKMGESLNQMGESLNQMGESLDLQTYQAQVRRLEQRLEHLGRPPPLHPAPLAPTTRVDPAEDPDITRLRKRLWKYRGKLTTFLHRPGVDATNNAAERAIRPAVVMRKITGGSRSKSGARAWAILASVIRTTEQQGKDVAATLRGLLMAEWAGQVSELLK